MGVTERDALEQLLAARTAALLRTAYLLTGDPEAARDLLQSALERVLPRLGRIQDPQALEAYVRKTMATTASNQRRRFWKREVATGQLPERLDQGVDSDTRVTLVQALQKLTPDLRTVLVLRFYEDLSEPQTADLLGIPAGTVKSRTSRGLQALRDAGIALVEDGRS